MPRFSIFSDSACDLPLSQIKLHNIHIVPYSVSFDGVSYLKEGVEISVRTFYGMLSGQNIFPKTSLPSIQDYTEAFRPQLLKGKDILCFCLTSKFSGSYQSACNAATLLQEEFPAHKILVVDTLAVCATQGLIVLEAANMRQKGMSVQDTYETILRGKNQCAIYITVDSLEYLQRGGRIGKVAAFTGNLLGIKPIISITDGELHPHAKARGRKKAVIEVVKTVLKEVGDHKDDYTFAIVHSNCEREARDLMGVFQNHYGLAIDLPPFELGVTIGAHIGPTVVGIGYLKKMS